MSLQLIIRSSTSCLISKQKVASCSLIRLDTIPQCAIKHGTLLEMVPFCFYNSVSATLFSPSILTNRTLLNYFRSKRLPLCFVFYFITNGKSLLWAFKSVIVFVNHHHFYKLLHIIQDNF